jgi:hypothetical protein
LDKMAMSKISLYSLAASAAGISVATALHTYCPSANDMIVAYTGGNINIFNQGWSISGGGGVATKAAFNMLGGSVEFDIDLSNVKVGVNANIYTVSPSNLGSGGFTDNQNQYCDGSKAAGSGWCPEVDWIESNGNCGAATTLHTVAGPGSVGCTAWGCRETYYYNGVSSFHMKIEYGTDGQWTTIWNGNTIAPSDLSPVPGSSDWSTLVQAYTNQGGVIYSSLWTGWVPADNCGTTAGDAADSSFSIKNLVVTGTVVQGPTPTLCAGSTPTAAPTSGTHTTPAPTSGSQSTPAPTSGSSSDGNCVALYGQCGGMMYSGSTCCQSGSSCQYQNPFYSQCSETGSGSTSTPSPTPAPTSSGNSGCAALYDQCGGTIPYTGQPWTGPFCCQSGSTCQYQNEYYSQCL